MTDENIIKLFFDRDEKAITELSLKYGSKCLNVSFNILNSLEDAKECVNDSYLALWNVIPPQTPNPLLTFLLKTVRNISLKKYRYNTALKRNSEYTVALDEIEEIFTDNNTVEKEYDSQLLTKYIELFLDTLSKENRVVFLRRYFFGDSLKSISGITGFSQKNVSVRLSRLRAKLSEFLKGCDML